MYKFAFEFSTNGINPDRQRVLSSVIIIITMSVANYKVSSIYLSISLWGFPLFVPSFLPFEMMRHIKKFD